ncbi:MAG TPA: ammonia-forming cytochrome c nitrite reductase subunit c552, partial [Mariniphaga sp.]|nr:ammonia-forming cytochrome c nitrite reductase subunit c552 [Mariniphaga sp.]
MRYSAIIQLSTILFLVIQTGCFQSKPKEKDTKLYSGSVSCIECHEKFYELWSGSHHGKAMQPVNHHFVNEMDFPDSYSFSIENKNYRMKVKDSVLIMKEINGDAMQTYEIIWALGGKNVFYFLTPMENGKLQTLPLAFDIRKKEWYNNPESAVRHFPEGTHDEALPWRDRMYTFNTSCYSCHVSQLSTNFDLATDTYQTQWKEPGINCETCHGPSAEHVRVCMEAGEGVIPDDLKIIITSTFTQEQHNSSCAPCHARMQPITSGYNPGEPYFDHYDLTTLEHTDFYPDGRDLGENYTYTLWLMNTCAQKGKLHCVSCHTSSGRNRFAERPNDACITCHAERVNDVAAHSMHQPDSEGSICINCHMPKTEFGRMIRSDHSFRPPMPKATIQFGSPNACNICHSDKSATWANNVVKKRENKNYQENTIYRGQLIKEARVGNWSRLDEMLKIINNPKSDKVLVTSFIRLLAGCQDETKWQSLIRAINNPSPLVRSAAATSLAGNQTSEALKSLIKATADSIRLVRVCAAS